MKEVTIQYLKRQKVEARKTGASVREMEFKRLKPNPIYKLIFQLMVLKTPYKEISAATKMTVQGIERVAFRKAPHLLYGRGCRSFKVIRQGDKIESKNIERFERLNITKEDSPKEKVWNPKKMRYE